PGVDRARRRQGTGRPRPALRFHDDTVVDPFRGGALSLLRRAGAGLLVVRPGRRRRAVHAWWFLPTLNIWRAAGAVDRPVRGGPAVPGSHECGRSSRHSLHLPGRRGGADPGVPVHPAARPAVAPGPAPRPVGTTPRRSSGRVQRALVRSLVTG